MSQSFYEFLKLEAIRSAMWTNSNADDKDVNRNHTNYGSTTSYMRILHELGHKTFLPVWEDDNGCLRIPFIQIDGIKIIEFEK